MYSPNFIEEREKKFAIKCCKDRILISPSREVIEYLRSIGSDVIDYYVTNLPEFLEFRHGDESDHRRYGIYDKKTGKKVILAFVKKTPYDFFGWATLCK